MSRSRKTLLILSAAIFLGVSVLAAMTVGESPTPGPQNHVPFRHGTGSITVHELAGANPAAKSSLAFRG